jgi:hypothetical protein
VGKLTPMPYTPLSSLPLALVLVPAATDTYTGVSLSGCLSYCAAHLALKAATLPHVQPNCMRLPFGLCLANACACTLPWRLGGVYCCCGLCENLCKCAQHEWPGSSVCARDSSGGAPPGLTSQHCAQDDTLLLFAVLCALIAFICVPWLASFLAGSAGQAGQCTGVPAGGLWQLGLLLWGRHPHAASLLLC